LKKLISSHVDSLLLGVSKAL